ncbi:MAG: acyl-CoA thioesterase [Inquilinus sp.]|nr:acyl-CoA thioesterase [Inquilinus sp.]
MGQVFYPNYARWADAAAWHFLAAHGAAAMGIGESAFLPLVAAEMQFLAPSRHGDRLEVVTTVDDLGATSLTLRHTFSGDGVERALVTEKRVHVVPIDGVAVPRLLPDALRQRLTSDRQA